MKNVNKYSYISHESTAEQAAQNIQNMEAQGYVPRSSSTTEIPDPTPFAPLGAGISTAALARFGTKKLVDKKKEEKEDKLNIEQWQQNDNTEDVTFSHELLKDADYLNPMDELAFQE